MTTKRAALCSAPRRCSLSLVAGALLGLAFAPGLPRILLAQGSDSCPAGAERVATLGITGLRCSFCEVTIGSGAATTSFDFEPEVTGIALNGPADGVLEEGDRIVAIDGHLITSDRGAARFAGIQSGERVRLQVRRGADVRDVELRASAYCRGQEPRSRKTQLVSQVTSAAAAPRILPTGWIGVGLECSWCSLATRGGGLTSGLGTGLGQPLFWRFTHPPRVHRVEAGGPAARAGLEAGDVLLEIDGKSLLTPAGGDAYSTVQPGQRVRFTIERSGARRTIDLVVGERTNPNE